MGNYRKYTMMVSIKATPSHHEAQLRLTGFILKSIDAGVQATGWNLRGTLSNQRVSVGRNQVEVHHCDVGDDAPTLLTWRKMADISSLPASVQEGGQNILGECWQFVLVMSFAAKELNSCPYTGLPSDEQTVLAALSDTLICFKPTDYILMSCQSR